MAAFDGFDAGVLLAVTAVALVIGVCGAALGLANRRRSRALQKRLDAIEEAARRAREREGQRARLRAFIEQRIEFRSYLTIENQGPGAARDLTISIDGNALERSTAIDRGGLDLAGLGAVGAHGRVRIPLHERPEKLRLDLTWSDGSGDLGFYEADLPG